MMRPFAGFRHQQDAFGRAAPSSTPRQNPALSRGSGSMKLTEAPPSTQSSRRRPADGQRVGACWPRQRHTADVTASCAFLLR
jgi:hypothetical protein